MTEETRIVTVEISEAVWQILRKDAEKSGIDIPQLLRTHAEKTAQEIQKKQDWGLWGH